jgi:2-polyprenyl-6-methoxyphenol hydroxylase-like FAD-dependent oxidoreductase
VPPTGGEGGNVALHDAALLVKYLTKVIGVSDQNEALETEIKEYEKEMAEFSWSKLSKAHRLCRIITVDGIILPFIVRCVLRIFDFAFRHWEGITTG